MTAAKAKAVIGPTPGTVIRRVQTSDLRVIALISPSMAATAVNIASRAANRPRNATCKPCAACKDVLGANLAVPHGVKLVDVGGLALRPALDDPLARVVVFVGLGVAVVGDLLNTVFFVPNDRAPRAVLDVIPTGLVAVQVIAIGEVVRYGSSHLYNRSMGGFHFRTCFEKVYFRFVKRGGR